MPDRVRARAADERPAPPRRPVTRLRLTCLYGGVFMVAGTALLAVVLLLAQQAVSRGNEPVLELGPESTVVLAPAACPGPAGGPPASCPGPGRERPRDPLGSSALLVLAGLGPLSVGAGYVTAGYALSKVRRITRTARGAYRHV
ncbi:hypothetical protein [Streptomyces sp. A0592]|uniref:hypothetical protein n=1 Tax=Streptomyces sp. A0592 TaxID=2563099 RepID=UPI00109E568D|nr:hypothetical protein [Streptomyces sp. A0592]THA83423.1 hypothetical protein E6U81_15690 [Streptomyces sp. A0592]